MLAAIIAGGAAGIFLHGASGVQRPQIGNHFLIYRDSLAFYDFAASLFTGQIYTWSCFSLPLFCRLYVENQRLLLIDIAWASMTSDFTRKTSCALQVYVKTLLRVILLVVAMNWMKKASTATVAWLSSVLTSKMLFQSKEPANTFLWISLMMKFRSSLYKVYLRAAVRAACCLLAAVKAMGSFFTYFSCHIFFTQNTALYDICNGNKSLGTIAL